MSYENPINDLIEAQSNDIALPSIWETKPNHNLTNRIFVLVASANKSVLPERQVLVSDAYKVASRSLDRTKLNFMNPSVRVFQAIREVEDFVRVSFTGNQPKLPTENLDLLPLGHPLTASAHISKFSEKEIAIERATWFAADPRVKDEIRPVIASAYVAKPNSAEFKFALASLEASRVPRDVILSLLSK